MITGGQVAEAARSLVGVPYVHQGRTLYGLDCIGLVIFARSLCGEWREAWLETTNYARKPKCGLLLARVKAHCTPIAKPEDGCMILIQWPLAEDPSHCGIYAGGNIIHAYQRDKKHVTRVVETGHRAHWKRDTHSYWRLPGVAPP